MTNVYDQIKSHFEGVDGAVVNSGKGAQGIKYKGKMFTMFFKGDLMVKLSEQRVNELVEQGKGVAYPHSKDRIIIRVDNKDEWIGYAMESFNYVSNS